MDNKSYYAIIPANVRYDENLKDKAKLLYGELTALTNDRGYCWASNNYFAELYKVSKSTISRLIKNLSEEGYIKVELQYENKEIKSRKIWLSSAIPIRKNAVRVLTKMRIPLYAKTSKIIIHYIIIQLIIQLIRIRKINLPLVLRSSLNHL